MNEYKYAITITTEKRFSDEQIAESMINMQHRLMGYTTETPEFMKKIEMNIAYIPKSVVINE